MGVGLALVAVAPDLGVALALAALTSFAGGILTPPSSPCSPWSRRPGCERCRSGSDPSSSCWGCGRSGSSPREPSPTTTACVSPWRPSCRTGSSAGWSWRRRDGTSPTTPPRRWQDPGDDARTAPRAPGRGPVAPPALQRRRRRLRQRAGALRRRLRRRRGRDRRPARHQRRRQVDAAQGHLAASCAPRAAAICFDGRDITQLDADDRHQAGDRADAGRHGRLPDADRRREPAPRRLAVPQGARATSRPPRNECSSAVPGPAGAQGRSWPATSPAASSRCSPSAWRFMAKPDAADDRRAVARPGADDRRRSCSTIVREIHAHGTTIILVEQSVNVALTLAERAVFMEKGEVRFPGPTAELLERPDVLRSVFLEGAADSHRARGGRIRKNGVGRCGGAAGGGPAGAPSGRRRTGGARTVRGERSASAASGRRRRQPRSCTSGEILGLIGPERCRQDHDLRPHLGIPRAELRVTSVRRSGHHDWSPQQRAAGGSRPLLPGRPPLPLAHRRREHRDRARAPPRGPRPAGAALWARPPSRSPRPRWRARSTTSSS